MPVSSRTGTKRSGEIQIAPWWARTIVIVAAVLMAAGGVIALVNPVMLASPSDQINGAVHIYAGYLASRNLCIAVMLLILLAIRSTKALAHLTVLTASIQIVDAVFDCVEGRWPIVPGVLILGALLFLAAARLSPFWKAESWS